jgi:hypothetical protein
MNLRLLVCGGRDYADARAVDLALTHLLQSRGIDLLIHGAARGADTLAADWAKAHAVAVKAFPADWDASGNQAGPIRNQQMLDEGRPTACIAFPGGRGTADMVRRAGAAGIPVWRV